MSATTREARLSVAFVHLADTLVAEFDIVDLLHTLVYNCTELLDVTEAGLVLALTGRDLQVMASTSERSSLIEALQLESHDGPCMACFETGEVVTVPDIRQDQTPWPEFRELALAQGFRSVHAVPLHLRQRTIGALNLFRDEPGTLTPADALVAQALADVATIGILQERLLSEQRMVGEQLQRALDGRIIIEQAKGVLSEWHRIPVDEAFSRLRTYARSTNTRLLDVASDVIERRLDV
jgi:GAF domain-containing protein